MKRNTLRAFLCAMAMVVALSLGACASGETEKKADPAPTTNESGYTLVTEGKLTVAASLDFPPFENLEDGAAVGFSVELTELVAEEMGLEAYYLPSTKFDTIVPQVAAGGTADVGVSSFTITDERKKEVDFTDPYCDSNQSIVVMKDSAYTSADDLAGLKVGAQSGTTGYDWALENIEGADVVAFDEMTAVFAALQSGQIDGIAVDLPVAQFYVKDAYTDAHVVQEIPTGEQYGMVVSKENPELTAALDEALAALKSNGKYDELYQKWFG